MSEKDIKSKLESCYLIPRADQDSPMFWLDAKGRVLANLDGYAIVPIEWLKRGMIQIAKDTFNTKTGFVCVEVLSDD